LAKKILEIENEVLREYLLEKERLKIKERTGLMYMKPQQPANTL